MFDFTVGTLKKNRWNRGRKQSLNFFIAGSIYILFRAPLSAHDKLTFIANNKIQFLTDRSNNRLNIDWSQSWIEGTFSHEIEGIYFTFVISRKSNVKYCNKMILKLKCCCCFAQIGFTK